MTPQEHYVHDHGITVRQTLIEYRESCQRSLAFWGDQSARGRQEVLRLRGVIASLDAEIARLTPLEKGLTP